MLLYFDSMLSYNTSVQNSIFMKRRNQNQKISFPIFAGSPHTPRRKRNCKEIFGFGIATEGSVRGASIIRQNPADFARNTFELRPIHTVKINHQTLLTSGLLFLKRRERDSNPREAFTPNGFQDRRLQPLSHLSKILFSCVTRY